MIEDNKGYNWLLTNEIMGFTTFSKFNPWYLLKREDIIYLKHSSYGDLAVFARRQDCDDAACLILSESNSYDKVLLIEFLSISKIEIVEEYIDIWAWLLSIIEDVREVVEIS